MGTKGELKAVGKRPARFNGPDIVTGRATYADDIQLTGMLYGRILRSPHGHAPRRRWLQQLKYSASGGDLLGDYAEFPHRQ